MTQTVFIVGNKRLVLKYERKMPRGEVERMKSFKTKNLQTLKKSPKFAIVSVVDVNNTRVYKLKSGSFA